jgi:hypothetical protein
MPAALAGALAALALLLFADPASAQFRMQCESRNYQYQFCPAGDRVVSARLLGQRSRAPCILGRTWGWQQGGLWVTEGCEGDFEVRTSHAPPPPPRPGFVTCESREYRFNVCGTGRIRDAQLVQQRSQAPCIRNRTWGVQRDGIWVDSGCEGTFRIFPR